MYQKYLTDYKTSIRNKSFSTSKSNCSKISGPLEKYFGSYVGSSPIAG